MRRIALALPDAAAAALYLWCWLAPLALMPKLVGLLVLVLLIEFVVIQAGPFIGNVVYGDRLGLTPRQRRRSAAILGATYLAFAGLATASFDAWFPFLIFVWLLGVKVFAAVLDRDPHALGRERVVGRVIPAVERTASRDPMPIARRWIWPRSGRARGSPTC